MINIFRKTRQSLLKENKAGKYLKYAIGEIILVMIGILLALQVNNWNSERLVNQRVNKFEKKLKIQLEQNISKIDVKIAQIEWVDKKSKELYSNIGTNNGIKIDAIIDTLIAINTTDYHLGLEMNVILEARENGDLALITKDSLIQSIYNIITINNLIKEREIIINSDLNNQFVPYLNRNFNFTNFAKKFVDKSLSKSKNYKGDNYKMLLSQEFDNYIFFRLFFRKEFLKSYNELKEMLKRTQKTL